MGIVAGSTDARPDQVLGQWQPPLVILSGFTAGTRTPTGWAHSSSGTRCRDDPPKLRRLCQRSRGVARSDADTGESAVARTSEERRAEGGSHKADPDERRSSCARNCRTMTTSPIEVPTSAAWRSQHETHSFASRPHDRFAIVDWRLPSSSNELCYRLVNLRTKYLGHKSMMVKKKFVARGDRGDGEIV
jgi:hypothetical protein